MDSPFWENWSSLNLITKQENDVSQQETTSYMNIKQENDQDTLQEPYQYGRVAGVMEQAQLHAGLRHMELQSVHKHSPPLRLHHFSTEHHQHRQQHLDDDQKIDLDLIQSQQHQQSRGTAAASGTHKLYHVPSASCSQPPVNTDSHSGIITKGTQAAAAAEAGNVSICMQQNHQHKLYHLAAVSEHPQSNLVKSSFPLHSSTIGNISTSSRVQQNQDAKLHHSTPTQPSSTPASPSSTLAVAELLQPTTLPPPSVLPPTPSSTSSKLAAALPSLVQSGQWLESSPTSLFTSPEPLSQVRSATPQQSQPESLSHLPALSPKPLLDLFAPSSHLPQPSPIPVLTPSELQLPDLSPMPEQEQATPLSQLLQPSPVPVLTPSELQLPDLSPMPEQEQATPLSQLLQPSPVPVLTPSTPLSQLLEHSPAPPQPPPRRASSKFPERSPLPLSTFASPQGLRTSTLSQLLAALSPLETQLIPYDSGSTFPLSSSAASAPAKKSRTPSAPVSQRSSASLRHGYSLRSSINSYINGTLLKQEKNQKKQQQKQHQEQKPKKKRVEKKQQQKKQFQEQKPRKKQIEKKQLMQQQDKKSKKKLKTEKQQLMQQLNQNLKKQQVEEQQLMQQKKKKRTQQQKKEKHLRPYGQDVRKKTYKQQKEAKRARGPHQSLCEKRAKYRATLHFRQNLKTSLMFQPPSKRRRRAGLKAMKSYLPPCKRLKRARARRFNLPTNAFYSWLRDLKPQLDGACSFMPSNWEEYMALMRWLAAEWWRVPRDEKYPYVNLYKRRLRVHRLKIRLQQLGIKTYRGLLSPKWLRTTKSAFMKGAVKSLTIFTNNSKLQLKKPSYQALLARGCPCLDCINERRVQALQQPEPGTVSSLPSAPCSPLTDKLSDLSDDLDLLSSYPCSPDGVAPGSSDECLAPETASSDIPYLAATPLVMALLSDTADDNTVITASASLAPDESAETESEPSSSHTMSDDVFFARFQAHTFDSPPTAATPFGTVNVELIATLCSPQASCFTRPSFSHIPLTAMIPSVSTSHTPLAMLHLLCLNPSPDSSTGAML